MLSRNGWTDVEIWLTKLETFLQDHSLAEARSMLEADGIRPVAAASQGGLLLSRGAERESHWKHFAASTRAPRRAGNPGADRHP